VFPCDDWLSKKRGLAREFPAAVLGGGDNGSGSDSESAGESASPDGVAPPSLEGVPVSRLVVNATESRPSRDDGGGGDFTLARENSIPVGKKSKDGGFPGGPSAGPARLGDPDELTEAKRDKATDAIALFGEHTVRCAFSKNFKHKVRQRTCYYAKPSLSPPTI
jgi:hypothetical protein